jgi:hypothetical protein
VGGGGAGGEKDKWVDGGGGRGGEKMALFSSHLGPKKISFRNNAKSGGAVAPSDLHIAPPVVMTFLSFGHNLSSVHFC